MSFSRFTLALSAFFVLALGAAFAGCGNSVPGNGVAKVSDTEGDGVTTTEDFNHWMTIAANRRRAGRSRRPGPTASVR